MSRRRAVTWIIALAVGIAAGGAIALFWVMRNPLAYQAWSGRRALYDSGFVQVQVGAPGGRTVVFVEAEDGPGRERDGRQPLVFLHGAGDQAGGWSKVAPAFTDGYRVVVPDLAGHGDSAPAAGPLPFDLVVEGFEGAMQELGLGPGSDTPPAILVGNSMGAWVASIYARRHPQRVARLVLVGGGPLRAEQEIDLLPADREEARELIGLLRDPESETVPDFVLDDLVEQAESGPIGRLDEAADSMEKYLLEEDDLARIGVPVELLWGASDRLIPESYARRLAGRLPRARVTLVPRCGHVPATECPERFRDALAELLELPPPDVDSAAEEVEEPDPGGARKDSGSDTGSGRSAG